MHHHKERERIKQKRELNEKVQMEKLERIEKLLQIDETEPDDKNGVKRKTGSLLDDECCKRRGEKCSRRSPIDIDMREKKRILRREEKLTKKQEKIRQKLMKKEDKLIRREERERLKKRNDYRGDRKYVPYR